MPSVLNLHVPPYDSGLDYAPLLREDLSIVGGSNPEMVPVGSRAVRSAIERLQPVLSLHGHIHESRGSVEIGRSVAVNPGSEYNTGVLRGVIVRLREDEVISTQFVSA
jgi:Icc-related predicted phosphoesterase